MIKLVCLLNGNILENQEDAKYIICDYHCRYFNACNDDFKKKVSALNKKDNKEDLPEETDITGPSNFDPDGFQASMEEDEIVEAMKLDDEDEIADEKKQKENKKTESKEKKPKSTKTKKADGVEKPKTKCNKSKKTSTALDLDDIEL